MKKPLLSAEFDTTYETAILILCSTKVALSMLSV